MADSAAISDDEPEPVAIAASVLQRLTVAQVKEELRIREVSFGSKLRKPELLQLLKDSLELPVVHESNNNNLPEQPNEPTVPWADSKARKLLVQDVLDGVVPLEPDNEMPLNVIFTSRPEFAEYGYTNFSSRLATIRHQTKRDNGRAADDLAAFEAFQALNIAHTHSPHGYPEWESSKAQKRLQKDIDDGLDKMLTPLELWCFREEYDDYPLKVFRDHIYQEHRTRKFYHTLKVKGKSKMKPKRKKRR